jgi:hypothetical protein
MKQIRSKNEQERNKDRKRGKTGKGRNYEGTRVNSCKNERWIEEIFGHPIILKHMFCNSFILWPHVSESHL